jgi:hemin uptake protein HemP
MMQTDIAPTSNMAEPHSSWPQRKRVTTADLMRGAREVIIVHEGKEYVLRITKTGKLILTK